MKSLSPALLSALSDDVLTLATCFRLRRTDGVVMGFTNSDMDISIDGLTYYARHGLSHSAIDTARDLRSNTLDIQGILSDDRITSDDLLSGVYDHARVDIVIINRANIPQTLNTTDVLWLHTSFIAEIRLEDGQFIAELKSLTDLLTLEHLPLYSPTCRVARFGNSACGVSLTPYTKTYTVSVVDDASHFFHHGVFEENSYFQYGLVIFLTGLNATIERSVTFYDNGRFTLQAPLFKPIAVGDSFKAIKGCDRRFKTCRDVFHNGANFKGEPPHLLPGIDRLFNVTD
jgi:uncharacterized phage protein (TIGR02218 family)